MSLQDVRQAIADSLSAELTDVLVSPYMLSHPITPSVHVFPDTVEFDSAMGRGLDTWQFKVQAQVGFVDSEGAQRRLDEWISGTQSFKTLIETDRTLGGVVQDARVTDCSGYRLYSRPDGTMVLGAEWTVSVLALGA